MMDELLIETLEGMVEDGWSVNQALLNMPSVLIAMGQNDPGLGILNEPIDDLVNRARTLYAGTDTASEPDGANGSATATDAAN